MAQEEKKQEDYYTGVTFVTYQSGNEPSQNLLQLMQYFITEMHKEHIRVYWANQIGKPGQICPPAGC